MKGTKRKLKIKWKNIALFIILLMCIYIVCHDLFMLTIYGWITGNICGWTWLGFLTFLLALTIGGGIIEYIYNEINK
ncbi:MAG: hypothetical protein HFI86_05660 [Bacilli bacterium]|nr:hypothetical protein [Bacilli bacterium]